MSSLDFFGEMLKNAPAPPPVKVSKRTLGAAIETTLMSYTRDELEVVLADELKLTWPRTDCTPDDSGFSKRDLIRGYTPDWDVPQMAGLARRIVTELDVRGDQIAELLEAYDRDGGVGTPTKNLIFAATGPKPELVLRDAISNDIEIVRNAEHCLVYEHPIGDAGLRFRDLIGWWRETRGFQATMSDRDAGLDLHRRLRASLGENPAELAVFDAYAGAYKKSLDAPALIPQVYLHYDRYTANSHLRRRETGPLARQRMDFLLLFTNRHRVVLEVDGRQHYAEDDGEAPPTRYAQMVAEDRRLRLAGYEMYRFGGAELLGPRAPAMLQRFFEALAAKMK